ncbi:hypothetical protein [Bacillus massiliigorillae]|uniref:hypothetical protein n=1 Tax=Bacillus massiliigorillae TaxID=1243664 RepID=UPI000399CFC2|nr:hypothetical protein [Bacillus massiliigorillae]
MKHFLKFITLLFVFSLAGCIGESYDYSPPKMNLSNTDSLINDIPLVEANTIWNDNSEYTKETNDFLSFARSQKINIVFSGQGEFITFNQEDFTVDELRVFIWKDNEKTELKLVDRSFHFPKDKGEYVIEVNLLANWGSIQYVGNILVK